MRYSYSKVRRTFLRYKYLLQQQLYGQVISILRQELDSMVRVMFLLSISDLNLREHFINQTLEGIKWSYPNTKKVVTDKQMVDLADKFYGWPFLFIN